MNEKTKRILSYVACTLGGVALGVALLGGLSYCSVSEKAEQTEVNTILTKRNAKTTTSQGGYDKYTFSPQSAYWNMETGNGAGYFYGVNVSTYDLVAPEPYYMPLEGITGIQQLQSAIDSLYNTAYNSTDITQTIRFVALYARTSIFNVERNVAYFSFVRPSSPFYQPLPFMLLNGSGFSILDLDDLSWVSTLSTSEKYYLTTERSNQLLMSPATEADTLPRVFNFQDIKSYYQERAYGDGYEQGYEDGNNVGYWAGYNDGVGTAGNFTNISGNVNAVIDLSELGVSTSTVWYSHGLSDSKYYTLLQFRDQDEESWTVYIEDGVASDQPDGTRTAYINLYSHSQQVYKGWLGYAVRNSSTNSFSVQQINEYSFEFATVTNVLGRSLTQEYVLIWGWVSDNVSYQAGYNAGYADGFEGTNVNNVFSLFTGAFNAVGGIFNLKVFGFLPLYWFFLTPIFIAIIALLLRMIKH